MMKAFTLKDYLCPAGQSVKPTALQAVVPSSTLGQDTLRCIKNASAQLLYMTVYVHLITEKEYP